ncbi:MAG: hypothetical protein Q7R56_02180 [Nanoarchaeota archaeon]|nr:hypothetical protein [Nanoarchaeota archaeon]
MTRSPSGIYTDKNIERILALAEQVRREGFPELPDVTITVKPLDDVYGEYSYLRGKYLIFINSNLLAVEDSILRGLLAHEFSHCVRDVKRPPKVRKKSFKRYNHHARVRRREEEQTDLEAIKRGYAKDLYQLACYIENNSVLEEGLPSKEILKYF